MRVRKLVAFTLSILTTALGAAAFVGCGSSSADGDEPSTSTGDDGGPSGSMEGGADGGGDADADVYVPRANDFAIVVFSPPPAAATSLANYRTIVEANFTHVMGWLIGGSTPPYPSSSREVNKSVLDICAQTGLKYFPDDAIFTRDPSDPASPQEMAAAAAGYASPALAGYYIKDEPDGTSLVHWADVANRIRAADPTHDFAHLNHLPSQVPEFAKRWPRTPVVSQATINGGSFVTPASPLAQTFTTPANLTMIRNIFVNIDKNLWHGDETLQVVVLDGDKVLGAAARSALGVAGNFADNFISFQVDAKVSPNTVYKWELRHLGGADGSVGLIGSAGKDAYPGGRAFVGGVAQDDDFYFEIEDAIPGETQEAQLAAGGGRELTTGHRLGQSFTVPADVVHPLEYVELQIATAGWSADEVVGLTLYDSPAKASRIAETSVVGSRDGYPRFWLSTRLTPGQSYYFEVELAPGGDGSVGRVETSNGADVYPGGSAYVDGAKRPELDLRFRTVYGLNIYQSYLEEWLALASPRMLSIDHYAFVTTADDVEGYYADTSEAADRAEAHGTPFWAYVQTSGIAGGLRVPDADELRWNVYSLVAYGASGIQYWAYWNEDSDGFEGSVITRDGQRTSLYAPTKQLNGELRKLGPILAPARRVGTYHHGARLSRRTRGVPADGPLVPTSDSPLVLGDFVGKDGERMVLVLNDDMHAAQTATLTVTSRPGQLGEIDRSTGTRVPLTSYDAASGVLTLELEAGDARLVVLP